MPRSAYVVEYGNIVSVYKMCVDKGRTRQTFIITKAAAESRTKERALVSQFSSNFRFCKCENLYILLHAPKEPK